MSPCDLASDVADDGTLTLNELLVRLRSQSVSVYVEGGRLRFRAPPGAIDEALKHAITAHRSALRELVDGRSSTDDSGPLVAKPRPTTIPLSHAQSRLWFEDQIGAGAAYDMPALIRVRGPLDLKLVERSLNAIVARHEALRTALRSVKGRPQQRIRKRLRIRVSFDDLSAADTSREAVEGFVQREAGHVFDLEHEPLIRAAVARVADDEHLIVLNLHHIVADAWSMRIFIREMGLFYESLAAGRPVTLDSLPIQYADYAIAQAERDDPRTAADLEYWSAALSDVPAAIELPIDRVPGPEPRYLGSVVRRLIPTELRDRLAREAASHGVTMLQLLLAAYATLLHRYSGQEDLVVGVPVANRERPEIAGVIGFFVGTLPIRVRFDDDPTFETLLKRVAASVRAALEHRQAPFERIVEAVGPERSATRAPLVQTLIGYQETPTAGAAVAGVELEILPVHNGTAKFELSLLMEDRPDGIDACWELDRDLFDATSVARLAANYEVLLDSICAEPAARVSQLTVLARDERGSVVDAFNATDRELPARRVDELLRAAARRWPERTAVSDDDAELTYQELDERSDQLAAALGQAGVRHGDRIAVGCDPGIDQIVALVAIVKAGGAYLTLALDDPPSRIGFVLADAGAALAIADPRHAERVRDAAPGLRLLSPTPPAPGDDAAAGGGPEDALRDPDDPLYLIYTSGSTGMPKGVVVPHRAVARLVHGQDYLTFEAGHTFGQWSNPCFDAFTLELWGALLHGGTIVGTPSDVLLDPAALAHHIRSEGISAGFLTASLFNEIARQAPTAFASMDTLLVGGEALEPRWLNAVLGSAPPRRLLNGYGPTECTTFACWHELTGELDERVSVPIGRPLANTTAYVVDSAGGPAPIGARGELWLGGPGVALGYHRRPELTAERFVPNPLGPGTLYRTGDLASWGGDGVLRYHGRLDRQVKVRGHRVELGEVEHALASLPDVRAAAVIAHRTGAGHLQLVAYVAPVGSVPELPSSLMEDLRSSLPPYMIPARWVMLEALPLTPSGKLDRSALPSPDEAAERGRGPTPPASADDGATPRAGGPGDRVQERVAILGEVWEEVLGVRRPGPQDSFFTLGGDSILAIQVAARAQARGLSLSPRQVIGARDLAELASLVTERRPVEAEQGRVAGAVPLTPIQRWFFGLGLAEPARCTQSLLLRCSDQLDRDALRDALLRLPHAHDALRLRFTQRDGFELEQTHGEAERDAGFQTVELGELDPDDRSDAIERIGAELKASMDLQRGPLLQAVLFVSPGGEPPRLLIAAHHLVVDAVSWRILVEDLVAGYHQLAHGEAVVPAAKTTSYKAWADLLVGWKTAGDRAPEAERWAALAGGTPDARWGQEPTGAASARIELDRAETSRLLGAPPGSYAMGLHEVLLAALTCSQTLAGGQETVRIDLEGHGREEELFDGVDLSRTVGWFTALYPMRFDAEAGRAPRELLLGVKERVRGVPAGGVSWGLLVDCTEPAIAATLGRVPPACIRFNYLGRVDTAAAGGLITGLGSESTGPDDGGDPRLRYPLEIEAQVLDGGLEVTLSGHTAAFPADVVARIAAECETALRWLGGHFDELSAPVYSPSDFPDVALDQAEVDALMSQLGASGVDL
jgi:amino acid adenylation domain-containing protein/non-ribosomal peptide synthase protein (TIGR01720 family)